ncbi:MAG: hypothetical protein JWO33_2423 [Caulobacteraceae bacterium]|nr:hypothetical protein [Caulobacteraceae bacterium]
MSRGRPPARRWLAAALVTLLVHGLVLFGLSRTPRGGTPVEPAIVEISLAPLQPRSPPAAPVAPHPVSQPLRLHQPPSLSGPVEASGFQVGAPSTGDPDSASPSPPQAAPASATQPKLKLDCLHMGPAARLCAYGREDCEVQRYARAKGIDGSVTDIPANPAWDAQIAKQMRVHQPLKPEQPNRNDCANSNLGLGCTDSMLVPLVKRKF